MTQAAVYKPDSICSEFIFPAGITLKHSKGTLNLIIRLFFEEVKFQ